MANPKNRWIGLVFISLAISLVIIDGTIVNTIFPALINDLGLSSTEVQWVQESYVLVFASLLLVWGSVADRVGRKRLLMIGIVIFIASSVWAGLTDSASALILARVIQGIGGAMVLPTTLSLVNATFQGKERGIAFAVWGATIGGMVAVGPVLGGWLATDFSWRWAFMINLPLGVLILVGLLIFVQESKSPQRSGGIDLVGAAISVVMFSTLVFGLIEGRVYGWWEVKQNSQFQIGSFTWQETGLSPVPVALAIFLVTAVIFVFWERHREKQQKNVLLDLALFKIGSFRNGSIAALIISMGEFGILFAIPLWLQNVLGLSPVSAGLVLLWLAGGAFAASGVGGALSGKLPAARAVQLGVLLELIGVAGIAIFASAETGWGVLAPFLFVYGLGIGLATAQLTGVIMVDVPMQNMGQASGSQSTVRQVGSALGIAVLGTLLFTGTQASLENRLADIDISQSQSTSVVEKVVDSAGSAIPSLEEGLLAQQVSAELAAQVTKAAGDAFTDGAKWAAWAAAGFLFLGFASTFNLGSRSERKPLAKKRTPPNPPA
ncbi:MFS transporter [Candidatus Aquiluna sp. UB-MaderosW2red]|uniref:MFS transporter n=1 Tax=Candidatus Aquiluna sp. UB-MaderosW2red TaxID=1855377 RepID=UPI000875AE1B|nr:MFS transporter [Candidatus Aquiluna sp. UB-MaderosW2red]SCX02934.1 drug resistance transporter, EmrB/QacA subfamily [Candidatus Aquiluna sp. UB-MaderosW2red]